MEFPILKCQSRSFLGKLDVVEMMFKPPRDWREVAGDLRECSHVLPEEALQGVLRDPRRFPARV